MKKVIAMLLSGFVLLSTLSGCTNTSTLTKTNEPQVIKVGVIAPLSGPAAVYGEDAVNLYSYVVGEFNKLHNDVKIQLVVEDGKCSGKDSTSAAQKLIMIDKVQVILGGTCSSETISAGKIAQENGILMLSALSSAAEISKIGDYVYRFYNDNYTAKKLADYLNDKSQNVSLVTENTDYGIGLKKEFENKYSHEIVYNEVFNSSEKDFGMIVNNIDPQISDKLVLVTQTESTVISLLKSLEQSNKLEKLRGNIYGVSFCSSDSFLKSAGNLSDKLFCVDTPQLKDMSQKGVTFVNDYKKTNAIKAFDSWVVLQKDAIDMILDAILEGNYDSVSMRDFIAKYTENNPKDGFVGKVYFDSNRDLKGVKYIIEQVQSGAIKVIE